MAKFKGAVKRCVVCDASFKVPACRADTAICCSRKCKDVWWSTRRDKTLTLICQGCGKPFEDYASHASKRVFCTRKCKAKYEVRPDSSGENNRNWKGGETFHDRGYLYVLSPGHPFAKNCKYVFQHRLVMEQWLNENDPDSRFLVDRDGKKYLDPKIIVHHRNGQKADNRLENLECMTQGEHRRHHHNDADSIRTQIENLQRKLESLEKEK